MRSLSSRLDRLEDALTPSNSLPRVFRVVTTDGEMEAAKTEAIAKGYDPDSDDFLIMRVIITADDHYKGPPVAVTVE
jgi:hypothetical protein